MGCGDDDGLGRFAPAPQRDFAVAARQSEHSHQQAQGIIDHRIRSACFASLLDERAGRFAINAVHLPGFEEVGHSSQREQVRRTVLFLFQVFALLLGVHRKQIGSWFLVKQSLRLWRGLVTYTPERLAIVVERRLQSVDVLELLGDLFVERGVPEYSRSDNGSEFTAPLVRQWVDRTGAKTRYIESGSPWENG
jgi:hypothetical protein